MLARMTRPAPTKPSAATAVITLCLITSIAQVSVARGASAPWNFLAQKPPAWFGQPDGRRAITNVLSWQSTAGLWPKNRDTAAEPNPAGPDKIQGSFDNRATVGEMRFLARASQATREEQLLAAFTRGLDGILAAQYPTGGWPQIYPAGKQYHRHITFNDGAMVGVMRLLHEIARAPVYAFLGEPKRNAAQAAFDRGVECILQCQIVVNGRQTVWCAQHDELDLRPRPGRSYELVSLSGSESAGILSLLMSLESPSPKVRAAIQAGAEWFAAATLTGIRLTQQNGDRVVIDDPQAPPLWARFYDVETGRPFFCGRDGIKKPRLADIEPERRNGYAWYGAWGESVAKEYATWSTRSPAPTQR